MKYIIAILCLATAAWAALPAPTHRVDDLGNCYRINNDGTETNLGQPADAIANNPSDAPGIQRAALKLLADFKAKMTADAEAAQADTAAKVAAADAAAATKLAEVLASAKTEWDVAIAERDARLAASAAYIATLQKALRDAHQPVPAP